MGKEIRWLNEKASDAENRRADKRNKRYKNGWNPLAAYKAANSLDQKDDAVAWALNDTVGGNVGDTLQKSMGYGFLTRFIEAFKWGSMTEDNLFIQLLRKIFSEDDANTVKSILCGKTPQKRKDSLNKINLSKNDVKTVEVESLNEDNGEITTPGGVILTPSAADTYRAQKQNNQEPEEEPVKQTLNNKPDPNEAKILDLSPLDMFMALYNGYLDQSYTTEDLVDIDSNQEGDSTITSENGDKYTIPNSLKNILLKSLSNNNAFAKGTESSNSTSNNKSRKSNYREVNDITSELDNTVKRLNGNERQALFREIGQIFNKYHWD